MGEWISVKERLPEKQADYLIWDGRLNTYGVADFWISDGGLDCWTYYNRSMDITHWMPLSEPPVQNINSQATEQTEKKGEL